MTQTTLHKPVLLDESIAALNINPEGIYIDGTFGRGGHFASILKCLSSKGRLIGCDKDPHAMDYARQRYANEPRVSFYHGCFSEIKSIAKQFDVMGKVNGLLLDCGVSSPQLDIAERGFSFMQDGPLDMRMNSSLGKTGSEWLNEATEEEVVWVLKHYGEEPFAKRIAKNIVKERQTTPISRTLQLAELVKKSVPAKKAFGRKHPATQTFQAIRLHVNQELGAIDTVLQEAPSVLAKNARLVVISFHSLEDRKVKQYFREYSRMTVPKGIAIPEAQLVSPFKWVVKKIKPSSLELQSNPRARSATLRAAEKMLDC